MVQYTLHKNNLLKLGFFPVTSHKFNNPIEEYVYVHIDLKKNNKSVFKIKDPFSIYNRYLYCNIVLRIDKSNPFPYKGVIFFYHYKNDMKSKYLEDNCSYPEIPTENIYSEDFYNEAIVENPTDIINYLKQNL